MNSRIVLGAATLGRLEERECQNFLECAYSSGIRIIDTAFGYKDSEMRIGAYLRKRRNFVVNSKVGMPDPSKFTPKGIKEHVEISLKRLGIDRINSLFVHSLSPQYLTEPNIETMFNLKQEGKVARVGFAGDGKDLSHAIAMKRFDDYMATVNIIDQGNCEILLDRVNSDQQVYYKLSLAQAIWKSRNFDRRLKSSNLLRKLFGREPVPTQWLDYESRFNKVRTLIPSGEFFDTFLKFALFQGRGDQFVVIGTQNCSYLKQALNIESTISSSPELVKQFEDWWSNESNPSWTPHNG